MTLEEAQAIIAALPEPPPLAVGAAVQLDGEGPELRVVEIDERRRCLCRWRTVDGWQEATHAEDRLVYSTVGRPTR
jgi:uncharacterized protein YodC (DUF2158 family)